MASTNQKWLIGCGVGCGMVLLVTALIGGGIFFAVKDVVKEAESIDGSFEAMEEAFERLQRTVASLRLLFLFPFVPLEMYCL